MEKGVDLLEATTETGGPLSPLLFNLVGDSLYEILIKVTESKNIPGLLPHLPDEGLTHLQYADYTVLFLQNTEDNISMLKYLLFCYEMLGIKTSKRSEFYVEFFFL